VRLHNDPVIRERAAYYADGVPGAADLCRDCGTRAAAGCCLLCDGCTAVARSHVAPAIDWAKQPACYGPR